MFYDFHYPWGGYWPEETINYMREYRIMFYYEEYAGQYLWLKGTFIEQESNYVCCGIPHM